MVNVPECKVVCEGLKAARPHRVLLETNEDVLKSRRKCYQAIKERREGERKSELADARESIERLVQSTQIIALSVEGKTMWGTQR